VTLTSAGTLTGTPKAGTAGVYLINFIAANGVKPDAVQHFTLTIGVVPAITSPDHATFTDGKPGAFSVRTTGFPAAVVTERGALPPGVRFIAGPKGTAVISGTAAKSARGKTYVISLTARNGVGKPATQRFSLRVS
jgi:hypothetical protein